MGEFRSGFCESAGQQWPNDIPEDGKLLVAAWRGALRGDDTQDIILYLFSSTVSIYNNNNNNNNNSNNNSNNNNN